MRKLLTILVLLWSAAAFAEGESLYIIQLQHRSADDVMPLLRPKLKPGEGLAGSGQQLLVSMSEPRRHEIEKMIAAIDVVPPQLKLSIKQSGKGESNRTITIKDGQRVFVRVGQSAAVVQRIVTLTGTKATVEARRVQLKDLITGFDVVARTGEKDVMLEVTPRLMGGPTDLENTFYFQDLRTNLPARRGQWIDLSSALSKASEVDRAILESATTPIGPATIQLKVD